MNEIKRNRSDNRFRRQETKIALDAIFMVEAWRLWSALLILNLTVPKCRKRPSRGCFSTSAALLEWVGFALRPPAGSNQVNGALRSSHVPSVHVSTPKQTSTKSDYLPVVLFKQLKCIFYKPQNKYFCHVIGSCQFACEQINIQTSQPAKHYIYIHVCSSAPPRQGDQCQHWAELIWLEWQIPALLNATDNVFS